METLLHLRQGIHTLAVEEEDRGAARVLDLLCRFLRAGFNTLLMEEKGVVAFHLE